MKYSLAISLLTLATLSPGLNAQTQTAPAPSAPTQTAPAQMAPTEGVSSSRSAKTMSITQMLELHAFPKNKQTPDVQRQDESACYDWARVETKFDPIAVAQQNANRQTPKGTAMKTATAGAGMGAVIGAIGGDAGKGAAMGAAGGAMRGRLMQKIAERQAEARVQAAEEATANFKRAYRACMEGKGYSIL
jgi:hypothetical protein